MAGKSDYLENAILDHVLGGTTLSQPAAVYVGLFTSAPTDSGGGTEVSGGGYAREAATFAAASGGSKSTSADTDFGTTTGAWGTVTHFGIFDAATDGNLLYWDALTAEKTVGSGDPVKFPSGDITVTED